MNNLDRMKQKTKKKKDLTSFDFTSDEKLVSFFRFPPKIRFFENKNLLVTVCVRLENQLKHLNYKTKRHCERHKITAETSAQTGRVKC